KCNPQKKWQHEKWQRMLKRDSHIFDLKKNVKRNSEDDKHRDLNNFLPGDLNSRLSYDGKDKRCKKKDTNSVAHPCGECSPIKKFFLENAVEQKYPGRDSCADNTHNHCDEKEAKCIFSAVERV